MADHSRGASVLVARRQHGERREQPDLRRRPRVHVRQPAQGRRAADRLLRPERRPQGRRCATGAPLRPWPLVRLLCGQPLPRQRRPGQRRGGRILARAHPAAPDRLGLQLPRQLERPGIRHRPAHALQRAAGDQRRLRYRQHRLRLVGSDARPVRPALRHGRRACHRHRRPRSPRGPLAARLLRRQRTGLGRAGRQSAGAFRPGLRRAEAVHRQPGQARFHQATEGQVQGT
ncbi:hypothetical protein D3C81_1266990 [compost metagenome]